MLASFILSLREGLEAALIIGIVLGALRKMQRGDLVFFLWLGAGTATLLSLTAALLLSHFGVELHDPAEAIFEGLTMLLAAGILTWMIFWMARQSGNIKKDLESSILRASSTGRWSMFGLAFTAVLREGIELALFLTASFFSSNAQMTTAGTVLGLGTAILLGWLLFATTIRLDLRRFFQATGLVLILFAAGMVVRAAGELVIAGWIPALIPHIWDLGSIVSDESMLGQTLGTLFGYSASPSLAQGMAYTLYFGVVLVGLLSRKKAGVNRQST